MAAESSKIKAKLANLNASLSELESLLEPLLSQSLPETLIGLEPIQQAKLQTVLPYLVYDLMFIYLKAQGIDPKTHTVVPELDRVRQYFEKIASAETPPIRRTEVDKDAAGRFIKQAISQAISKPNLATIPPSESGPIPAKITTKMLARAQYEHTLKKEREENEDNEITLQIFDEPDQDLSITETRERDGGVDVSTEDKLVSSKRQRPAIDPFDGYGDENIVLDSSRLPKKSKKDAAGSSSVAKKQKKTKKAQ
ncbi:Nuclear nucleic acid-binding protein C1D [Leucoagaricus sp. SymC.cos]|nr:Nuclear nucleic acid-binding protein C1D [Leucoagaricus sp. SymC.cos]